MALEEAIGRLKEGESAIYLLEEKSQKNYDSNPSMNSWNLNQISFHKDSGFGWIEL